jgi:hypothetical protein
MTEGSIGTTDLNSSLILDLSEDNDESGNVALPISLDREKACPTVKKAGSLQTLADSR